MLEPVLDMFATDITVRVVSKVHPTAYLLHMSNTETQTILILQRQYCILNASRD